MKLDILVLAAHPDDAEIGCGATLFKLKSQGLRVGVVDLTRGELGTRGNPELRAQESAAAAQLIGLDARENLGLADGFFAVAEAEKRAVISAIRHYQPDVVLANAPSDRHPDHGRAATLAREACFYAFLRKIETTRNGQAQAPWRPRRVLHYIQDHHLKPSLVVDVSEWMEQKFAALRCYSSQFYDPQANEPGTPISGSDFFPFLEARARETGRMVGVTFGEGFISMEPLLIENLAALQ